MKINIRFFGFEILFCRRHYDINIDEWVAGGLRVRIGKHVWSRRKGYRRLQTS